MIYIHCSVVILAPNEDRSINNILYGIGLVAVILLLIYIIFEAIRRCVKMYRASAEEEQGMLPNI